MVTRSVPESAVQLLRTAGEVQVCERDRALEPAQLREVVAGAHGVVAMLGDRIDDELVTAAGPQLQVVANVAVGYDNIDVPAVTARGVTVTNTPGVLVDATADLTLGLLLMVTRRLGEGERAASPGRTLGPGRGVVGECGHRERLSVSAAVYAAHHT